MTPIAPVFRYVHELYKQSRAAAVDAVEIATKGESGWRHFEWTRWIRATSTWHDGDVNLVPWCALSWRQERESGEARELTLILRYWSRVFTFEPMIVAAYAEGALPKRSQPGLHLEEGLRNPGWVKVTEEAGDRVVELRRETRDTQARYRAFAVSMDRLIDAEALQRHLATPVRALISGDLAALVAALPEDPARVVFR